MVEVAEVAHRPPSKFTPSLSTAPALRMEQTYDLLLTNQMWQSDMRLCTQDCVTQYMTPALLGCTPLC